MRKFDNWTFEELNDKLGDLDFFNSLTDEEEENFRLSYFSKERYAEPILNEDVAEYIDGESYEKWNISHDFVVSETKYCKKMGGDIY